MKIRLTILFLIFNYIYLNAQIDTTVVPFVSYWSTGDSYDFRITKIKQKWSEEELVSNDSSAYNVNFLVTDSTATSYTIQWSYQTNLNELNIPNEFASAFSDFEKINVIYKTTEVGEFVEVENWEEISKQMKSMMINLVELIGKEHEGGAKAMEKLMKPLMEVYESQEGIEQIVLKELQYFHYPFGLEYDVDEVILYKDALPNMFGGKPIEADVKLYFTEVDFEDRYCEMVKEMKLNPEDTKSIVTSFFKKMKLKDKEMKNEMMKAVFEINDYNVFQYYYYPGVPLKIETNRESIIQIGGENVKRVDISRIELL